MLNPYEYMLDCHPVNRLSALEKDNIKTIP